MRLYHVTPWDNVSQIRKRGLLPKRIKRGVFARDPDEPRVYLFVDLDTAEDAMVNWLLDEYEKERFFGIIQVDLPDDAPVNEDPEVAGSVYLVDPIPARFISGIEKINAGEA